jgi:hypothetical protein
MPLLISSLFYLFRYILIGNVKKTKRLSLLTNLISIILSILPIIQRRSCINIEKQFQLNRKEKEEYLIKEKLSYKRVYSKEGISKMYSYSVSQSDLSLILLLGNKVKEK